MNKLELKRNLTANKVNHYDRYGKRRNSVNFSTAESMKHFIAKCKLCYNLREEGKEFLTEARFNNGSGRADILVLDDDEAIEIVMSESEKSIKAKEKKYPVTSFIKLSTDEVLNDDITT